MPKPVQTKKVRTSNQTFKFINPSDKPSEVVDDIAQFSWWLFGVPKIGKTDLVAQFPSVRFCATEIGHKSQSLYLDELYDEDGVNFPWPAYEEWLEYQRKSKYKTSAVDVLEKAYDSCFEYMKQELGITGDPQWAEWNACRKPFIQWCKDLLAIPGKGTVFISHATAREIEDTVGETSSEIHPNFSGKVLTAIEGEVDILAYYHFIKNQRVLQIQGDDGVRSGNRLTKKFRCAETGEPIKYIPMGKSAEEGYQNILRAFENEQSPKHLHHIFPPKEPKEKDEPKKPKVAKKS